MTVIAKNKAKEWKYDPVLATFIILIKMQIISECLEIWYLSVYNIAQ